MSPSQDAERFGQVLSSKLGIESKFLVPAREDWLYYLWRESQQPAGVDNIAIPWAPQYRDDLSLALARGLDRTIGYALPLRWDWGINDWRSGTWLFPRGEMFLMPGGSPMGLRLPLGQLPWAIEEYFEYDYIPPSVQATAGWLIRLGRWFRTAGRRRPETKRFAPISNNLWKFRTPRCASNRVVGHLYVFMPRLENFDHYAALLTAIEDTAAELKMPVLIEGYEPPSAPQTWIP